MAIAFVAEAHATSAGTGVTSLAIDVPAGTQNGHALVAVIGVRNTSAPPTITPPSGWDLQTSAFSVDGTGVNVYTRIASSEPSSYTWSLSASSQMTCCIAAFSGVDTGTLADVSGSINSTNNATTANIVAKSITTVTNSAFAVCCAVSRANFITVSPTGWESIYTYSGIASTARLNISYKVITPAGATGDASYGGNNNTSSGASQNALRPASTGQPMSLRHGVAVPGLAGAQWRQGRSF